jgi:hypothetical protein
MSEYSGRHPLATAPGALAVAVWSLYVVCAVVLYYPDFLASVLISCAVGLLASAVVVFGLRHWRAAIVMASSVYLVLYAVRVIRMATMTTGIPFTSAVASYYNFLSTVTAGIFAEKGMAGGVAQVFLEYVMPVSAVVLIAAALLSSPRRRPGGIRTD